MTRDGVVLENQTTGEEINISDREAEQDFTPAGATGRAEKVLERADRVQERRAGKRAAKQAGQVEADTGPRPSARLQFSEEERSTPELKKYIRKSDQRADRLDAARAAIPKETVKIKEKVSVWMNEQEYRHLKKQAELAGLGIDPFLRALTAGVQLRPRPPDTYAALLRELSAIGNNVNQMKVVGQTTAKRLARDPAPAVVIPIKAEDKAKFQKLAKEFGVLYFFAQKKGNDNGMLNVVSNENYAALLNAIMQQLGYPIPQKEQEEDTQKKAKSRAPQKKSSPERGSGLKPSQTTAGAVEQDSPTKKKLDQLQRLAAQSRPGPEKSNRKVR